VSPLVTGEAVTLELQHARAATRSVAFAIDVALQAAVLTPLLVLIVLGSDLDGALLAALSLTASVLVLVGYPVLFETLTRGRTPGKMAMGLRVTRDDGGPIRFRHALVRGLGGFFVDFWALGLLGFVGLVVSLSSSQGKRVGDYLAGTVVIRVRAPSRDATVFGMPDGMAQWARSLDLSGLPDDLALAVRQYLSRAPQLSDAARLSLGQTLTEQVADHIGTAPPPGATPCRMVRFWSVAVTPALTVASCSYP
jgi:uncharacterized RDD family membrane protein YckC